MKWVLKGETVIYAAWDSIKETLDYDFNVEKQFSYEGLSFAESVKYLELFFSNLLMGTAYELKNRYMHLDYMQEESQSATSRPPKCKNCTLDCTLEELAILRILTVNPQITQKELVNHNVRS